MRAIAVTLTDEQYRMLREVAMSESIGLSTLARIGTISMLRAIECGDIDESILHCAVMRAGRTKGTEVSESQVEHAAEPTSREHCV